MTTRSNNTKLDLLLASPGEEHLAISGRKLPTYKQVLLCFLAHREKCRREDETKRRRIANSAADAVIDQVRQHYGNAGISLLPIKKLKYQILALNKQYVDMRKIESQCRARNEKLIAFRNNLCKTMPLWPKDEIKNMEASKFGKRKIEIKAIDEDIAFLKNMMSSRTASYTCKDLITSKYKEMRQERQQEALERASKHRKDDMFIYFQDDVDNGLGEEEYCSENQDGPKRKHRRSLKTGVTISIPFDVLKNPKIVSNYTRNKISVTAISSFMRCLITECGADADAVCLGYSSAYRYVLKNEMLLQMVEIVYNNSFPS